MLLSGDVAWETLIHAVSTITSQVPGINRCVWNLGTIHPERASVLEAYVTREQLHVLRRADAIVMQALHEFDLYDDIWQRSTVLAPLSLTEEPGETVVLRPVRSQRAMTATPVELPLRLVTVSRTEILELDGVSGLTLDVTSKPPGTIEWEQPTGLSRGNRSRRFRGSGTDTRTAETPLARARPSRRTLCRRRSARRAGLLPRCRARSGASR